MTHGTAAALVELAASRPATLGPGRLLCIDGPAGSGKTTLAARVQTLSPGSHVVHTDDLLDGWDGLARIEEQLADLLVPLSQGRAGSYRRFDWSSGQFAETVAVPPRPLLVLEGVGSGATRFAALRTVLVWVEAPHHVRLARSLARDGATFAAHWDQWARDEEQLFARQRTRLRADMVVDGTPAG